jgi:hypothetical protein
LFGKDAELHSLQKKEWMVSGVSLVAFLMPNPIAGLSISWKRERKFGGKPGSIHLPALAESDDVINIEVPTLADMQDRMGAVCLLVEVTLTFTNSL